MSVTRLTPFPTLPVVSCYGEREGDSIQLFYHRYRYQLVASISADERIPNIVVDDAGSSFDDGTTSITASPVLKRSRVRELAKKTKQKTKNILNFDKAESDPENDVQDRDIFVDPAFNPAKVLDGDPAQPGPKRHRVRGSFSRDTWQRDVPVSCN